MTEYDLVIVGGGPLCTYALERLSVLVARAGLASLLRIAIFDRTGMFGAGATHSETQARTSYMNRVASQIAFAADESNPDATFLLPKELRPTLAEWAHAKFLALRDEKFNLRPGAIPRRYLHGEALREMFGRFATMLRAIDHVELDMYDLEITDVSPEDCGGAFRVEVGSRRLFLRAQQILFVTGHSENRPTPRSTSETLARHARQYPSARYISQPYPLERRLTYESVPEGSRVAVLGLGLTAIDILLHLTEGRGGKFAVEHDSGGCPVRRYTRSGREPGLIVCVSPSGLFPSCRPENEKALDSSGRGHAALEHRGEFLTSSAISTMRTRFGVPARLSLGEIRQLDFDLHIFPLLVLEMAYVYYTTLLGRKFGNELRKAADDPYNTFLQRSCSCKDLAIEQLLAPVQGCFDRAAAYIKSRLSEGDKHVASERFDSMRVVENFLLATRGSLDGDNKSPWNHSSNPQDHRFCWQTFFQPVDHSVALNGESWRSAVLDYMRADQKAAAQGNLRNPSKAASDGVWRDLRSVLAEAVDFGGLTAESHSRFMRVYFRLYSRMANGIGLEAMSRILALVESGLVDISTGPEPEVEGISGRAAFLVRGTLTGVKHEVTAAIQGRTHPFDPVQDINPLYPNLIRRGLVRQWVNPGRISSQSYCPGGLDLSKCFHPIQSDLTVERRLTFLGAPAEGTALFQLSAARPHSNSAVLNNVARWANHFTDGISSVGAVQAREDSDTADSVTTFRSRLRSLLKNECGATGRTRRNIIIFAVDGIPYDLACSSWPNALVLKMRSVFPTTSATAWLSSLTGAEVRRHGIPGVAFREPAGSSIMVFEYRGRLDSPATGNIFSDAADLGYSPISVVGDLEPYDCTWRSRLLAHSRQLFGHRFYTASENLTPSLLCAHLREAVTATLECSSKFPRLVWCFIDVDRRIHHHGYDTLVHRFLHCLDSLGRYFTRQGCLVLAHSDHGLTPTTHNAELQHCMDDLQEIYQCPMGGAGRTRWLYPASGTEERVSSELRRFLPSTVDICSADQLFGEGSLARSRVGEILLVAKATEFVTASGYRFDHGSLTEAELNVPFARWEG